MRPNRLFVKPLLVHVTPKSVDEVLRAIEAPPQGKPQLVIGHNLHSVHLFHSNADFAEIYGIADLILVDGQPVRWAGRLSNRDSNEWMPSRRVGSVDWIRQLGDLTSISKVAIVGGSAISNARTVNLLTRQLGPGTQLRGWHGEDWNTAREAEIVGLLNSYEPNLTLIGLGMPLQENFYLKHRGDLPIGTYALVGGAIDQISGVQRRAPAFIGRFGVEWLWRLVLEPRRLWRRYLREPIQLAKLLVLKHLRIDVPPNLSG